MCICFTPSQQDNYKCYLACNPGLGNAVVTVKAATYQSPGLCAHTWLGSHTESRTWTFPLLGTVTSPLLCRTGGGLWDLIWHRVISGGKRNIMTVYVSCSITCYQHSNNVVRVPCLFPLGFSWSSKALLCPSIWQRLRMSGTWASSLCCAKDLERSWRISGRSLHNDPRGPQNTPLMLTCLRAISSLQDCALCS